MKLIMALILIESGGDPLAVGDGGRAVGVLQIHPVMVAECNRLAGEERWTLADRTCRARSIQMATIFLSHMKSRNPGISQVRLGETWNTGSMRRRNPAYQRKLLTLMEDSYEPGIQ